MQVADQTATTLRIIEQFNDAFNRHDLDTVMSLMTPDVVFQSMGPAPDGRLFTGQQAVRQFWEAMFATSPDAHFEGEDIVAAGDRCTVLWKYTRTMNGVPGHVRGVDVFRLQDGLIVEKLSYIKG